MVPEIEPTNLKVSAHANLWQELISIDPKKLRRTALVAFFVSLSAQVNFEVFADGFIIALSPAVMAIFIYCYEVLSPIYIIVLSGVFSPIVRMLLLYIHTGQFWHSIMTAVPDMVYFLSYALFYALLYRFVFKAPKSMQNFPFALFFCDLLSNTTEMLLRSIFARHMLLDPTKFSYLALVALVRTALIMTVVIAVEAYGNFLINKEHDEEYKRLLTQASAVEGEMRVMNKNVKEVEGVMKKAYDLYYQAMDRDYPKEVTDRLLEIAKDTHEIKGDYVNVLGVLNHIFLNELKDEHLTISEIISLERSNVLAMIKKHGYETDINTRINTDFQVTKTFKLMSVIRNLLTNSMEAIGKGPGKITVTVSPVFEDPVSPKPKPVSYMITVRDNGPGIPDEAMANIFLEGYSTKFDPVTGNIERGLGLSLVKDYIENDFGGKITISSEVGKYTAVILDIPCDMI